MLKKTISYAFLALTLFFFVFVFAPNKSYAAGCDNIFSFISNTSNAAGAGNITEKDQIFQGIGCAIQAGTNTLMDLGMMISIIMIAWGGFTYATAGGSKERTTKGISTLQSAILGLAGLLLASTLLTFILSFMEYNAQVKKFQGIEIKLNLPPSP